jgi:hypothetical protein
MLFLEVLALDEPVRDTRIPREKRREDPIRARPARDVPRIRREVEPLPPHGCEEDTSVEATCQTKLERMSGRSEITKGSAERCLDVSECLVVPRFDSVTHERPVTHRVVFVGVSKSLAR